MYFITNNEHERDKEMKYFRNKIANAKKCIAGCENNRKQLPEDADYWNKRINWWLHKIYDYRRELARLIARVNRHNAHFYSWRGSI